MGSWIGGGILLAVAVFLAILSARDFGDGVAAFKSKWTFPQFESVRADDPVGFWLLTLLKIMMVAALAYFGLQVMLSQ